MDLFPTKKTGPAIIEETIGQFTAIVKKLEQGTQDCMTRVSKNYVTIQELQSQNKEYESAAIKANNVIRGVQALLNGGELPAKTEEDTNEDSGSTDKG